MNVYLAKPRGYCAGVDRAIDVVQLALKIFGPPVYMRHEIVHNTHVVSSLERAGAIFVENTAEIPVGSVAVFSAHGVSPTVRREADERHLKVIDATCPLVNKVHLEAKMYAAKGYTIALVGHRGHVEMEGTMGEAPNATVLIDSLAEARNVELPEDKPKIILTQTTLSLTDTAEIITELQRRFPGIQLPPKEDICYATTNRQTAVRSLADTCQVILVLGSSTSSNSKRLRETAERHGSRAYLIEDVGKIQPEWLEGVENVGVTSGASAPESLVTDVVEWLRKHGATQIEEIVVLDEEISFTLPSEIIEAARSANLGDHELLRKHEVSRKRDQ